MSRQPWNMGLATIPDAEESRNVILPESIVREVIAKAYEENAEFGLLVEIAAVTGARVSQVSRLEVQDVQGDRADPRLMMPSSRKGRGQKKIMRRPVPIPTSLVARLRLFAAEKPDNAALLVKPSGTPWSKCDHSRLFQRAATSAGLDASEVTINALRHSVNRHSTGPEPSWRSPGYRAFRHRKRSPLHRLAFASLPRRSP